MIAIEIDVKEESNKGVVLKLFLSKGSRQGELEDITTNECIVASSVLVEISNTLKSYTKKTNKVVLDLTGL